MFEPFRKERPLQGMMGGGGGVGGRLQAGGFVGADTFTIYLWGAGADSGPAGAGGGDTTVAGFSQVTIPKPSIPGTYTRFEVQVGQQGVQGSDTSKRYGGGGAGGGNPSPTGTPGGGGTFVFLSSPTQTQVLNPTGFSIDIPTGDADGRCVAVAGGAGGRDVRDNEAAPGGGGYLVYRVAGPTNWITNVSRTSPTGNSLLAYIGVDGGPGPQWSSGGGGGGYAAGSGPTYDYPGFGGTGFVGTTSSTPGDYPFIGPSPVNGLTYDDGVTLGSGPLPPQPGTPAAPYAPFTWTLPSDASPHWPGASGLPSDNGGTNGLAVIIDNATGTATNYTYSGGAQWYNFP